MQTCRNVCVFLMFLMFPFCVWADSPYTCPEVVAENSLEVPWEISDGGEDWKSILVPEFYSPKRTENELQYRCKFRIPAELRSARQVALRFEGVKFWAEVLVDGQRLGEHLGGFEAFEFLIPNHTEDVEHSLLVRVKGLPAIVKEPVDWSAWPPGAKISGFLQDQLLYPAGSAYSRIGIWEPVHLVARNEVVVEDLFIQTSVRKHEMRTNLVLRNRTEEELPVSVECVVEALGKTGGEIPQIPSFPMTLPAGACGEVSVSCAWQNPDLWHPEHPNLYRMHVRVLSEDGKVLGETSDRFGFREFWCDGPDFYLNGQKIHLLATARHPGGKLRSYPGCDPASVMDPHAFYADVRACHCNAIRLHANVWSDSWFRAADEDGMLMVMESSLFCWAGSYCLKDDAFWKNMEVHIESMIRKHRNNPSIVILSMCNEILHCGGARFAPDCETRLAKLGVFARSLDPTRPIMFDGDMDPKLDPNDASGVADIINPHYPMDFDARHEGYDTAWPQCCDWMEDGKIMACYPWKYWRWEGDKPLYFGEFLHIQHFTDEHPYSLLLGDDAYRLPFNDTMGRAKAIAWRMQLPAYRMANVSGLCPWTLNEPGPHSKVGNYYNPRPQAVREGYEPVTFFIAPCLDTLNVSESTNFDVCILNDSYHPQNLVFRATWNGREVTRETLTLAAATQKRLSWSVAPPEAGSGELAMSLESADGQNVPKIEKTLQFRVRKPDSGFLHGKRWAMLPTPDSGKVADWNSYDILVVSENALQDFFPTRETPMVGMDNDFRTKLLSFLERGGTLLVLHQDEFPQDFLPVQLARYDVTIPGFGRHYFAGKPLDCTVAENPENMERVLQYQSFVKRPFNRASVPAWRYGHALGSPSGMTLTDTFYLPVGRGLVVLDQSLGADFEKTWTLPAPFGNATLAVIDPQGTLIPALSRSGLKFEDVTRSHLQSGFDPSAYGAVWVSADTEPSDVLKSWMSNSTLPTPFVLHGLTPENMARWHFSERVVPSRLQLLPNESVPVPTCEAFHAHDFYWLASRTGKLSHFMSETARDIAPWSVVPFVQKDNAEIVAQKSFIEILDPNHAGIRDDGDHTFVGQSLPMAFRTVLDTSRPYFLVFEGRGAELNGEFSKLQVLVDGRPVTTLELSDAWQEYRVPLAFTAKEPGAESEIRFVFTNDQWDPISKKDRNLWLRPFHIECAERLELEELAAPGVLTKIGHSGNVYLDQVNWPAPENPAGARADFYVAALGQYFGIGAEFSLQSVRIPGATFDLESDKYRRTENQTWQVMGTAGKISKTVQFGTARDYRFTLSAQGTQCNGIYPHFIFLLDGQKVCEFQLTHEGTQELGVTVPVAAGEHRLTLHFDNDLWDPETRDDRNARVLELRVE